MQITYLHINKQPTLQMCTPCVSVFANQKMSAACTSSQRLKTVFYNTKDHIGVCRLPRLNGGNLHANKPKYS